MKQKVYKEEVVYLDFEKIGEILKSSSVDSFKDRFFEYVYSLPIETIEITEEEHLRKEAKEQELEQLIKEREKCGNKLGG